MDASGREVMRHGNLPATMVRVERNGMANGMYHCMLIDARTGRTRILGHVIAQ
jgi:hypothetical protein